LAKSLLDRMAGGMARGEAIMRAKQEGHSFGAIGAALGISRQAVHQAMRAWKDD
jgi:biotin operon repressor